MIPIMMPSTIAMMVAASTKRIVIGIARDNSEATVACSRVMPKLGLPINSPNTPFSQRKYLAGGGTSN